MIIKLNNKNLQLERSGRGQSIIFIHGWGGSLDSLRNLANLASKNFDSILLELPGFGQSDNPETNWGVPEYGAIIYELINKLELVKPVYFGHSFGGGLGIFLAANYPYLFAKLILCNSAYRRNNQKGKLYTYLKNRLIQQLPFYKKWGKPAVKIAYRLLFRDSDLLKYPHLESNFRKIMTQDLSQYASKIQTPTLLIWGENDRITPLSSAFELQKAIINSHLVIVPKTKHNLPLVNPTIVYQHIHDFIR